MNRFVIADSTVCIGCRTCEAACSETHRQHGLQAMPRLQVMRNEKESAPQMCHHCEDVQRTGVSVKATTVDANNATMNAIPSGMSMRPSMPLR